MAPNAESKCPFASAAQTESRTVDYTHYGQAKASEPSAASTLDSANGMNHACGDMPELAPLVDKAERVPSRTVGADPQALLKALLPLESALGLGALAAALLGILLPRSLVLLAAAALVLPPLVRMVLRSYRLMRNPDAETVRLEAATDKGEGEFCVFLLGARNNAPFKLDKDFAYVGNMFGQMLKELEALPESSGFLGADPYIGTNFERGSHVMAVMYWRSYDHMLKFTHDSAKSHTSAMKQLAKKMSSMPHIGLWHEAYIVKPGQHESLYVNCPPLGLGAAMGLRPAKGPLSTSRGRVRASQGAPGTAKGK